MTAGLDGAGRLTALWTDTGNITAPPPSIAVASGPVGGPLGPRQILDGGTGVGSGFNAADLAVAADGRAIAAWRRYGSGRDETVIAVRSGANGRFRVRAALPGDGFGGEVAVLPGGEGVLASRVRSRAPTTARPVRRSGVLGRARPLRGATGGLAVATTAAAGSITIAWGTTGGLRVATYRP